MTNSISFAERAERLPDGAGGAVSALLYEPERPKRADRPPVILGHGAGTDLANPLLASFARGLGNAGFTTLRFNFRYTEAGRRRPDPRPVLEETWRAVLHAAHAELGFHSPVIGGRSMGGRIASHLAAEGENVTGLVFLGYPLHPAGRPDRLRDEHLPAIRAPMLFLAGTRDTLADLELLRRTITRLSAPVTLHVVEGADHGFRVPKRKGRKPRDVETELVDVTVAWLGTLT